MGEIKGTRVRRREGVNKKTQGEEQEKRTHIHTLTHRAGEQRACQLVHNQNIGFRAEG